MGKNYVPTDIHTSITLNKIKLHYMTLRCIALHWIALHCIALHHITIHTYITSSTAQGRGRSFKDRKPIGGSLLRVMGRRAKPLIDRPDVGGSAV